MSIFWLFPLFSFFNVILLLLGSTLIYDISHWIYNRDYIILDRYMISLFFNVGVGPMVTVIITSDRKRGGV